MVDMETGLSRLPRQAGTTVYTRPKPLLDPQLQSTHHVPSQCVYEALTPPPSPPPKCLNKAGYSLSLAQCLGINMVSTL